MALASANIQRMNRADLTRRVLGMIDADTAVIGGIGNAGFDLFSAEDRPANFYMLGSMGMAVPIGFGLALAQPERTVIVMEGEGSVLMTLGSLATVGREAPPNLTIVVWDNAQWQLTGGQTTATGVATDLSVVAQGCGIANSNAPTNEEEFERAVRFALDAPGPHAIVAHIDAEPAHGRPHDDPIWTKYRFMQAMGQQPE